MRIAVALALAAGLAAPAGGPSVSPQTIFVDPLTSPGAQHETAVEPDTFAFGDTVVAAFQVGRFTDGGAAAIGWATSVDGGRTWASGLLPGLTTATQPGGPFTRVTDPAVAYDQAHGVWLVAVLAMRGEDSISSLVIARSKDGRSWSQPATAAAEGGDFAHDKSWIACDNGRASAHAGRCYLTWTDVATEEIVLAHSRDGGLTWGDPVEIGIAGTGSQPVPRPDGSLVVLGLARRGLAAARSRDGGASFGPPAPVGGARAGDTAGMRAPPLPSVEVDRAGRIWAAWHHCGLSPLCGRHDVVLSSSADGSAWTPPVRVTAGAGQTILPGLAVDSTTAGPSTRLALAYYRLTEVGCPTASCIAPEYVSSADAGSSWSAPVALGPARPVWMHAEARGRFVGDYVSTSFVTGGVAVPVVSVATPPTDGRFHQAIVAAAVPPLPGARLVPLTLGRAAASPAFPRAGGVVTVSAGLTGPLHGVRARCRASVGAIVLAAVTARAGDGRARCTWRLPRGSSGRSLAGAIVVTAGVRSARRAFSLRVR